MIVVEGPDGAGKTTLIEALMERFDLPVAPRVVSKDAVAMVDLMDWVDNNLEEGFQRTIFDRHRLISETIYGPILRTEPQPGFTRLSWMAPRLARFYRIQPIIIYCLPPLEVVKKNIIGDHDNQVVWEKIEAIYSAYVNRASLDIEFAPGKVFIWDYTHSPTIRNEPVFFNEINKLLNSPRPRGILA